MRGTGRTRSNRSEWRWTWGQEVCYRRRVGVIAELLSRPRMKQKNIQPSGFGVDSYSQLVQFVEAFAEGHLNLLILLGQPGLAKSQTVRRPLGDQCWIEGNATAFGVYGTPARSGSIETRQSRSTTWISSIRIAARYNCSARLTASNASSWMAVERDGCLLGAPVQAISRWSMEEPRHVRHALLRSQKGKCLGLIP